MKAHVIENDTVVNTIIVDSLDFLPNLIDGSIGTIGWKYINGSLIEPDPEPISDEELSKRIKSNRNGLLIDSDWTQVADAPVDKAAWATYRQALRDIPNQEGFPTDVAWPAKPE